MFFSNEIGKWFVITSITCKHQLQRKKDIVLWGLILEIIHPKKKSGTISKSNRKPALTSYVAALQEEAENGPEIKNLATPRHLKRYVLVIYDA